MMPTKRHVVTINYTLILNNVKPIYEQSYLKVLPLSLRVESQEVV